MIRVLLVDDHPLFRAGARASLTSEPDFEVMGEANNAWEAVELIESLKPDVVLTDIRLKGDANGVELARRIRQGFPDVKIVVLTNYSNEPYIRAMMEVGVEAYMLKDTPPRDVIESVRMVMEGRAVFSSKVSRTIVKGYVGASSAVGTVTRNQITEREADVLQLLVNGATNADIAETLHVSQTTVQYHLTNLYGKLGVKGRSEAIVQAAREGLVVIDE